MTKVRKRQIVIGAVGVSVVLVLGMFQVAKPAMIYKASTIIQTTINKKLNGTCGFTALSMDWRGRIILQHPFVKDNKGRLVLTSNHLSIQVSPFKMIRVLQGQGMVEAIDLIEIQKPVVHVWQEKEDHIWNVLALVKKDNRPVESRFGGNVVFHDGTVRLRLADGQLVMIETCSGTVKKNSNSQWVGSSEGTLQGKKFRMLGQYTNPNVWQGQFRCDEIDAPWINYVFSAKQLSGVIEQGKLQQIQLGITKKNGPMQIRGEVDLQHLQGVIKNIRFAKSQGHIVFNTKEIKLQRIQGLINGQDFQIAGKINFSGTSPTVQMAIDLRHANMQAFHAYIPKDIRGKMDFSGTVNGSIDDFHVLGRLKIRNGQYRQLHVRQMGMNIKADQNYISLDNVQAQIGNGQIKGQFSYAIQQKKIRGKAHISSLDLRHIPEIPASIEGTVTAADVLLNGRLDWHNLNVQMVGEGTRLNVYGVHIPTMRFQGRYQQGKVFIHSLRACLGDGYLLAHGEVDIIHNTPNVWVQAQQIAVHKLGVSLPIRIHGLLNGSGHIVGKLWQWNGNIHAERGSIASMKYDEVDGVLQGQGKQIHIPRLVWKYDEGRHTIQGDINIQNNRVNLRVDTTKMRVEDLLKAVPQSLPRITGWVNNQMWIRGTLMNPQIEGNISLWDGSIKGYLYQQIKSTYTRKNSIWTLKEGSGTAYDAHFLFKGNIGKTCDVSLSGTNIDVYRLLKKNDNIPRGKMELQLHLKGAVTDPILEGRFSGKQFAIRDTLLTDIQGDIYYHRKKIALQSFQFRQKKSTFSSWLQYDIATQRIRGEGHVEKGNIPSLIQFSNVPLQHITGQVDGDISLDGYLTHPKIAVRGWISEGNIAGYSVEPAPIDIMYDNKKLDINTFTFKSGQTIFAAKGVYTTNGPVNMQVALKNVSSKALFSVVGRDNIPLVAPMDVVLDVRRKNKRVQADVSLQIGEGTFNHIPFSKAYALGNIKEGKLILNQVHVSKGKYRISANGMIPLETLRRTDSMEPMSVALKLDNANLDALTFITPLVKSAQGDVKGTLNLGGTVSHPLLHGNIAFTDGMIQFRDLKYPLTKLTGVLSFNGQKGNMNISGDMDKESTSKPGHLTVMGKGAWKGWQFTSYQIQVDADHLYVDSKYYKGPLQGHMRLENGKNMPKLSGNVMLEHVTMAIPLVVSDSTFTIPIGLDLTVTAGNAVRLYNSAIYDLMIKGTSTFKGTTLQPHAVGKFVAQSGSIRYLDTNFKITKAQADFSQRKSLLPVMDIEGYSKVGQYDVTLIMRGPADQMDLVLRSNPPLTKTQIVSLITLRNSNGKQLSTLDDTSIHQLFDSGIRMTLNSLGITQKLEQALSLDRLIVTNGSLNLNDRNTDLSRNYYNIEMGKYVRDNIMLTAAFGLNHKDNRLGVEYDLMRGLSLNAWKSRKSLYLGGTYRYMF